MRQVKYASASSSRRRLRLRVKTSDEGEVPPDGSIKRPSSSQTEKSHHEKAGFPKRRVPKLVAASPVAKAAPVAKTGPVAKTAPVAEKAKPDDDAQLEGPFTVTYRDHRTDARKRGEAYVLQGAHMIPRRAPRR